MKKLTPPNASRENTLSFKAFREYMNLLKEQIWRDYFARNSHRVRVKKEGTVVKNLVKIFEATLAISNEKGFQAMSVRDLSRETDLSMGALYSYFSSKEELLDMIQEQGRLITLRILLAEIDKGCDPMEKLHHAILTHLFLSEIMRPLFYFSYMEAKNLSKEEQKRAIESELFTEKLFVDILAGGQKKGIFRSVDRELTAAVIKAMLQDWYLKQWKYQRRKISVEDYGKFLINFVEAFLLPLH
ncbi:MAG: TetR/AcrR family transcriptional regulator [Syntrophales bacterium]|jgi:AcrR family transcriptional regulator